MKLATLKEGGRDGTLIVINQELTKGVRVAEIALTLQTVLDDWHKLSPQLLEIYKALCQGSVQNSFPINFQELASPLPRAYQWADGSAYLNHVELVRKARGAEMPPEFKLDPLMYQGGSDSFIGPCDPIECENEEWGIDFESEIAVITDDVPMGIKAEAATNHIKLLMLVNDVSLRNLIPGELGKGFGFFQSKPATAFSPVAVTPDELGEAWNGKKVSLPLKSYHNDNLIGEPNAGNDMNFDFTQLISHAAKTRELVAGSIIGSGTISNRDRSKGSSCLSEIRMIEKIDTGEVNTPFMKFGDRIKIEMLDNNGQSIFGRIEQEVKHYQP